MSEGCTGAACASIRSSLPTGSGAPRDTSLTESRGSPNLVSCRACIEFATSNGADRPSIDRNHRASDVRGSRGDQERRDSPELRRLTVPAQRNVFRLAGTYLIGIAAESIDLTHPFGRNPDRQDAVHPGSGKAKFLCEHLDYAGETREPCPQGIRLRPRRWRRPPDMSQAPERGEPRRGRRSRRRSATLDQAYQRQSPVAFL